MGATMSTTISLPSDFNFPNSNEFCLLLESTPASMECRIDYGKIGNVEPWGMLLIGSAIRRFVENRQNTTNIFADNIGKNEYAAHMGFYKSIGLDYGKAPGEAKGGPTYLPITQLKVREIREESRSNREHVVDTVERTAGIIATVLSCENKDLKDVLTYSIREIMRNVVEHSDADSIWFAGQIWPTKDKVEISIIDEGIGIQRSLKSNAKLRMSSTDESLYLAIEPGISGKDVRKEAARDGVYGNSGYGLYMTSRICEEGGDFLIGSMDKALGINKRSNGIRDFLHYGTAIRMRLRPSNVKSLSSMISRFLKEGEERNRKNKNSDVISASKSSRLLLTDN